MFRVVYMFDIYWIIILLFNFLVVTYFIIKYLIATFSFLVANTNCFFLKAVSVGYQY